MGLFSSKFLGIDIGTAYIKIAEITKIGGTKKLSNYGFLSSRSFFEKPFRTFEQNTFLLSNDEISLAIKTIMSEANIKTRQAIFSIPDFATLFSSFELPPMAKDELFEAVRYEAKQHIPLPLEQVALDWQIIESKPVDKKRSSYKILLSAVPLDIVNQYQEIARLSNLKLYALESEVFSLIRALVKKEEKMSLIVLDIGMQSTTGSVVENGVLKISHSFDIGGNSFIKEVSENFNLNSDEAEKIIMAYGLQKNEDIKQVLIPFIESILQEVEKIINEYQQTSNQKIQKIILAGGLALLPGLKEYISNYLKFTTDIANPLINITYPSLLEEKLKKMAPSFSIAIGAALRGWTTL